MRLGQHFYRKHLFFISLIWMLKIWLIIQSWPICMNDFFLTKAIFDNLLTNKNSFHDLCQSWQTIFDILFYNNWVLEYWFENFSVNFMPIFCKVIMSCIYAEFMVHKMSLGQKKLNEHKLNIKSSYSDLTHLLGIWVKDDDKLKFYNILKFRKKMQ